MSYYKISVGILSFVYACFIFSYPLSFFNDDSLFLARGIDNFSVIDFSPHFPGYPFIVLFGKFINIFIKDSKLSLFLITSLCSILLPALLFLYVKQLLNEKIAFITFLLTISSPYLINLCLSIISDSVGIFFLFLSLYFIQIKKSMSAGITLSIALFSRPSYLVFYVVIFIYLFFKQKEFLKKIFFWFFITLVFFILYIFLANGILYIYEAKRFIFGHFFLWGVGQNSDITWLYNIFSLVNLPFVFLFFLFFNYDRKLNFLLILFITYAFWILYAQNPDNLRHIIPLIFISTIFISKILEKYKYLIILILIFNLFILFSYNEKLSPIDQIIRVINDEKRVILSNRSIEILRKNLKNRVCDSYYIHNSNYLSENKKVYLITALKPKKQKYMSFKGRFWGEKTLYLIKN